MYVLCVYTHTHTHNIYIYIYIITESAYKGEKFQNQAKAKHGILLKLPKYKTKQLAKFRNCLVDHILYNAQLSILLTAFHDSININHDIIPQCHFRRPADIPQYHF